IGALVDAGGPGRNLFWNPVVWAYGVTLVTMALAAWFLEQCDELPPPLYKKLPAPKAIAAMLQVGAAVSAFLLLTLEVRWGFHAGKLDDNSALLVERGTFAVGWLLLASAITWIGRQMQRSILIRSGEVIAILGLVYAVIGLVCIANPLWWQWFGRENVGAVPVFNLLLYVYGAPAVLCGLLAFVLHKSDPENSGLARAAGAAGVILILAMVSLQVHQGFAGGDLALTQESHTSFIEYATYSSAWMALGVICLALGRRFGRDLLRRAGILLCSGAMAYAVVVVGFILNPFFYHEAIGSWPVLNQLLFAYGTPLVLAVLAAWIVHPRAHFFGPWTPECDIPFMGGWSLGVLLRTGILILLFILVTTEVRQGFQGQYLDVSQITFIERSTYPIAWLIMAVTLVPLGYVYGSTAARRGGVAIAGIGMAFVLLIGVGLCNPLWSGEAVGGRLIFNDLFYAYGLPAALCCLLAWMLNRHDPAAARLSNIAAIVGLLLLLATVSLEVRQGYVGPALGGATPSFTEFATYAVAWMALGLACLAVDLRWHIPVVHKTGALLSAGGLVYVIAIVGVILNPVFHESWVGDWPVFNHVLFAYGTPILLAALGAWMVHPRAARIFGPVADDRDQILGNGNLGRLMHTGIVFLLFLLVTTEVRQGFQGAYLNGSSMNFLERGTYPVAWFTLAGLLLTVGYKVQSQVARRGGLWGAGLALAYSLLVCTLVMNPLFTHEHVGGMPVINGLLYVYGIATFASALLARTFWKCRIRTEAGPELIFAWVAGVSGLVLAFALVTLEVQHTFRGDNLYWGAPPANSPPGEFATYSLVWALLGIIYLVAGILRRSVLLRWASLVMMLVTIPKVFLFDMPALQNMQRVLSFAGTGISLMALAFVYQRFVFRKPSTPLAPAVLPDETLPSQKTQGDL
ncbi:MAG: DUF2339 domain-containing protein, partial [Phycisphaerae bacterium]